jgi:hypothetical protein
MSRKKARQPPKRVLRLPDLGFGKSAVLNTFGRRSGSDRTDSQSTILLHGTAQSRVFAFNETVVLRCRLELESGRLSPSTINLRLAAVRRLAYEAADIGLLSPELAAGIRRVKGANRRAFASATWLSTEQNRSRRFCAHDAW